MLMSKQISDEALFEGSLYASRRELVIALIQCDGSIEDRPSGRATRKLFELTDLSTVSSKGMSGLLAAMDEDGWIMRDMKGKRTYEIVLCEEHEAVARLINRFPADPSAEEPQEEEADPIHIEDHHNGDDTPTPGPDVMDVADALILRVVDILNNPTSEDVQHRLAEQIEECQRLRRRLEIAEGEKDDLTTRLQASQARTRTLTEENTQLNSNLRAALRQERVVAGEGVRQLERFMQQRPQARQV